MDVDPDLRGQINLASFSTCCRESEILHVQFITLQMIRKREVCSYKEWGLNRGRF